MRRSENSGPPKAGSDGILGGAQQAQGGPGAAKLGDKAIRATLMSTSSPNQAAPVSTPIASWFQFAQAWRSSLSLIVKQNYE
ncbi:MAG TPA: hypothetical protein VN749_15515 [Candidatus Eisenbacteria bacterium]|nr:hypothetical protein [Candidatus Eisenbacteria bacterium]